MTRSSIVLASLVSLTFLVAACGHRRATTTANEGTTTSVAPAPAPAPTAAPAPPPAPPAAAEPPAPAPAPETTAHRLPKTASEAPSILLGGLALIGLGLLVRQAR